MLKIISANSSAESLEGSVDPKQSQPRPTNWPESFYHLLGTKEAYNESVFHKSEADTLLRAEYRLRRQTTQLGFQVIPVDNG